MIFVRQIVALLCRHTGCDCVSNHQPHWCLLIRSFRRRSKKTSKFRVTGLCSGNSPVTGEFPTQLASDAEMFPFDDVIMGYGYCSSCSTFILSKVRENILFFKVVIFHLRHCRKYISQYHYPRFSWSTTPRKYVISPQIECSCPKRSSLWPGYHIQSKFLVIHGRFSDKQQHSNGTMFGCLVI